MSKLDEYKSAISEQLAPVIAPAKEAALNRWDELNDRDQLIVRALGVLAVILFLFVVIYAPIYKARSNSIDIYNNKAELLSWMSSVAPSLQGAGGNAQSPAARSMINDINTRAAALQLKLGRVQPEGASKLRVSIQDSSFNVIMAWLNDLQSSGIVVTAINIDAESQPGIVNAKVLLRGGSS